MDLPKYVSPENISEKDDRKRTRASIVNRIFLVASVVGYIIFLVVYGGLVLHYRSGPSLYSFANSSEITLSTSDSKGSAPSGNGSDNPTSNSGGSASNGDGPRNG